MQCPHSTAAKEGPQESRFVHAFLLQKVASAWCLAGEDALVLGGAVEGDHVQPFLGSDGVGGGEGSGRDRHRLGGRVVRDGDGAGKGGLVEEEV